MGKKQCIYRDLTCSVIRPVKDFQKTFLKKGEAREVIFTITTDDLKFYTDKLQHIFEPGEFKLYIGGTSVDVKEASFNLQ
jgi:beta-glucosidase